MFASGNLLHKRSNFYY